MSNTHPETKAFWQLVVAGILSTALGAAGVLVLLGWHAILVSAMSGLAVAAGAVVLVRWLQYRSGMYRCRFCHTPLKGPGVACDCPGARAAREEYR